MLLADAAACAEGGMQQALGGRCQISSQSDLKQWSLRLFWWGSLNNSKI